MIRYAVAALTAGLMTVGAVSSLQAETTRSANQSIKVTVDEKTGKYCITQPASVGSRIPTTECHSTTEWAKLGVNFVPAADSVASR